MSKHTLESWEVVEISPGEFSINSKEWVIAVIVSNHPKVAKVRANLIAASPDLYAAASAALDAVSPGSVKDLLIEALLKADGGSK